MIMKQNYCIHCHKFKDLSEFENPSRMCKECKQNAGRNMLFKRILKALSDGETLSTRSLAERVNTTTTVLRKTISTKNNGQIIVMLLPSGYMNKLNTNTKDDTNVKAGIND